jgi:hypothetical protein
MAAPWEENLVASDAPPWEQNLVEDRAQISPPTAAQDMERRALTAREQGLDPFGASDTELAQQVFHQIPADIGAGVEKVGRGVRNIGGAEALLLAGEPTMAAQQLGVPASALSKVGLTPEPDTGETPIEQGIKSLPVVPRVASQAAYSTIQQAPRLAATALMPEAAPAIWGVTPEGFNVKQAAIATLLPVVGKWLGAATEAVAARLGVTSDTAGLLVNKLAGASGAAGIVGADQMYEISKLPEDKKKDAWIDAVANTVSMAGLGLMGGREAKAERPAGETLTGRNLTMPEGFTPEEGGPAQATGGRLATQPPAELITTAPPGPGGAGAAPSVIDAFVARMKDDSQKTNNGHSNATGLSATGIEDLEKLRASSDEIRARGKALLDQGKTTKDPVIMNQGMLVNTRAQLPREAIEVATNTGSWIEGGDTKLGPRPLDWRTHPEVAAWLAKHAESLKITLPDDFKAPEFDVLHKGAVALTQTITNLKFSAEKAGKPIPAETLATWQSKGDAIYASFKEHRDSERAVKEFEDLSQQVRKEAAEPAKAPETFEQRMNREEDANDWIKSAMQSKRPPKSAEEAWNQFTAYDRSRGVEVPGKDYFMSAWESFSKPAEPTKAPTPEEEAAAEDDRASAEADARAEAAAKAESGTVGNVAKAIKLVGKDELKRRANLILKDNRNNEGEAMASASAFTVDGTWRDPKEQISVVPTSVKTVGDRATMHSLIRDPDGTLRIKTYRLQSGELVNEETFKTEKEAQEKLDFYKMLGGHTEDRIAATSKSEPQPLPRCC